MLEQFVHEGFAFAAGRKSVHVRLMIAVGELGGNSEHSELLLTLHRLPLRIGYDWSIVEQCFYSEATALFAGVYILFMIVHVTLKEAFMLFKGLYDLASCRQKGRLQKWSRPTVRQSVLAVRQVSGSPHFPRFRSFSFVCNRGSQVAAQVRIVANDSVALASMRERGCTRPSVRMMR